MHSHTKHLIFVSVICLLSLGASATTIQQAHITYESYAFSPQQKPLISLSIGGTKIKALGFNVNNQLIYEGPEYRWRNQYRSQLNDRQWFANQLLSEINRAWTQVANSTPLAKSFTLGIAWPGTITAEKLYSINIPGFQHFPGSNLQQLLQNYFDNHQMKVDIVLLNDADAGAQGWLNHNQVQNGTLLTIGTGIGAGLISDGKLYDRPHDFHERLGEFSQLTIYNEKTGRYHYRGNQTKGRLVSKWFKDSLNDRLSGPGMAKRIIAHFKQRQTRSRAKMERICKSAYPVVSPQCERWALTKLHRQASVHDPDAQEIIKAFGFELGQGLAAFYRHYPQYHFDEHIMLDGGVGRHFGGKLLADSIQQGLSG